MNCWLWRKLDVSQKILQGQESEEIPLAKSYVYYEEMSAAMKIHPNFISTALLVSKILLVGSSIKTMH
jgi:hypothetical protein